MICIFKIQEISIKEYLFNFQDHETADQIDIVSVCRNPDSNEVRIVILFLVWILSEMSIEIRGTTMRLYERECRMFLQPTKFRNSSKRYVFILTRSSTINLASWKFRILLIIELQWSVLTTTGWSLAISMFSTRMILILASNVYCWEDISLYQTIIYYY